MASKKFQYTPNANLQRAKEQLRDLQSKREASAQSRYQLRLKVQEAKEALDLLELKSGFERVVPSTIAAARENYQAAKATLQASEESSSDMPESVRYLAAKIDELERVEFDENTAAMRPVLLEGLRRLDAALESAASITSELVDLRNANRALTTFLPDTWEKEFYGPASKLTAWRETWASMGWPTK